MDKNKAPHYIIVGCMKSGTTSLVHHFSNHEEIHIPKKELHFFDRDDNFSKGENWYKNQLFEGLTKDVKVIGEKTATYSYHDLSPERIQKLYPDAKIIWVFRNPIDRSYSNYLHAFKGGEDIVDFEFAIKNEKERSKKKKYLSYTDRSLYYKQVNKFLEYFPKEQMFFTLFEDLIQKDNPNHILYDVFDFLEVSRDKFVFKDEPRNPTVLPRFPKTLYAARKSGLLKIKLFEYGFKFLNTWKKKPGYTKLTTEQRKKLYQHFVEANDKLESIIGVNLDKWKA